MRASDVQLPQAILGRGRGRVSSDLSPIRILSPLKYPEAITFLLCRDYGTARDNYWMSILIYILEYVMIVYLTKDDSKKIISRFITPIKHGDLRMYTRPQDVRRGLVDRQLLPNPQI
jgi:hypothetical protein